MQIRLNLLLVTRADESEAYPFFTDYRKSCRPSVMKKPYTDITT